MSKDDFILVLKDSGFNTGYASDTVPTIYVKSPYEINRAHTAIKEVIKEFGYAQSYGISIMTTGV